MTRAIAAPALIALMVTLGGCSLASDDGATTETKMRNVEILAGTASDEMILLDQASGDGTAIDPSTATGPQVARDAADEDAEGDTNGDEADRPAADNGDTDAEPATTGDQTIRPPSGGAEADRPREPAKR